MAYEKHAKLFCVLQLTILEKGKTLEGINNSLSSVLRLEISADRFGSWSPPPPSGGWRTPQDWSLPGRPLSRVMTQQEICECVLNHQTFTIFVSGHLCGNTQALGLNDSRVSCKLLLCSTKEV